MGTEYSNRLNIQNQNKKFIWNRQDKRQSTPNVKMDKFVKYFNNNLSRSLSLSQYEQLN